MSIFSKDKQEVYKRKISGFWDEYKRNKIGIVGLLLLGFFIFIAVFGRYITPFEPPNLPVVASKFARPEWLSLFPGYDDLPRTLEFYVHEMEVSTNSLFVEVSKAERIALNYACGGAAEDTGDVNLELNFIYPYTSPDEFRFKLEYSAENVNNTKYSFRFVLIDANGKEWDILNQESTWNTRFARLTAFSTSLSLRWSLFKSYEINPAPTIFSDKGNYSLILKITFNPILPSQNSTATVYIGGGTLTIYGKLYGVLGTDAFGFDVFSQVVAGAPMSMIVGLSVAVISTSLAIVVGTTAGYFEGKVDTVFMRIADVILCLPLFVLLLALKKFLNMDIFLIILFISFFFWTGPARTIRSKILSIKESMFIESAKAAGGTSFYIIRRHLIPNIFPLAMASLVLFVPAGILMEASLSFLGFGDPNAQTWGRTLSEARASGAFTELAWWYIIPPGFAITFLCLAFVFIGHALDSIVNPRLRRRK